MATDKILVKLRSRDTSSGVTRETVNALMEELEMSATQVVHIALSRFAAEILPAYERDDGPLTAAQLAAIRKRAKAAMPQGKVLSRRTLFG